MRIEISDDRQLTTMLTIIHDAVRYGISIITHKLIMPRIFSSDTHMLDYTER